MKRNAITQLKYAIPDELELALKQEEADYIDESNKKYESEIKKGLNQINDVGFMDEISGSEDSEGEELYQLLRDDCPFTYEELIENDGVRRMVHPGVNNVLQSLLQSLLAIQLLRPYFMKQQYKGLG